MDVIKGAISERLTLDECFVRQYKTSKSYGTLVSLVYDKHTKKLFPNPQKHGAVPFEESEDAMRLKVIEWAIPKVCISAEISLLFYTIQPTMSIATPQCLILQ